MFPSSTSDSLSRRTLRERLRDVLGATLEFATLGEYGLAPRPAPVSAGAAAAAPVPLPFSLFGDTRPTGIAPGSPAATRSATVTDAAAGADGDATRPAVGRDASGRYELPADVDRSRLPRPATAAGKARFGIAPIAPAPHPHMRRLQRPTRPRRPGAVPPLAPVCTMPVAPSPARTSAPKTPTSPTTAAAERHHRS